MTDSLKFGPEWLRNLSQPSDGGIGVVAGGSGQMSTVSAPLRYMLAEHRYGREEMLAMYSSKARTPEALQAFPMLQADKPQPPLALLQMTEEETRMWQRGINSDAVLRQMGKLGPVTNVRERGRGGATVVTGGMDRGRGRGRSSGNYYPRGLSYEEESSRESGGIPINTYASRGRYERSQSGQDRVWGDRNGSENTEWNGSTSPRKDFLGRSAMDNWRSRGATEEDGGGWKTSGHPSKWNRNSWRESCSEKESESSDLETGRAVLRPPWENKDKSEVKGKWSEENRSGPPRRSNDDLDHLPEWAMANPIETGGSFDATGAFHGGTFSDDEEGNINANTQRNKSLSHANNKVSIDNTEETKTFYKKGLEGNLPTAHFANATDTETIGNSQQDSFNPGIVQHQLIENERAEAANEKLVNAVTYVKSLRFKGCENLPTLNAMHGTLLEQADKADSLVKKLKEGFSYGYCLSVLVTPGDIIPDKKVQFRVFNKNAVPPGKTLLAATLAKEVEADFADIVAAEKELMEDLHEDFKASKEEFQCPAPVLGEGELCPGVSRAKSLSTSTQAAQKSLAADKKPGAAVLAEAQAIEKANELKSQQERLKEVLSYRLPVGLAPGNGYPENMERSHLGSESSGNTSTTAVKMATAAELELIGQQTLEALKEFDEMEERRAKELKASLGCKKKAEASLPNVSTINQEPIRMQGVIGNRPTQKSEVKTDEKLRNMARAPHNRSQEEDLDLMRNANALVAKLTDEDERPHRQANILHEKWYYRDPQGDVQGPFSSQQMLEWFKSGYFNKSLELKKENDAGFSLLGELMALWGTVPFADYQQCFETKDVAAESLCPLYQQMPVPIPMPGQPVAAQVAPVAPTDTNRFMMSTFLQTPADEVYMGGEIIRVHPDVTRAVQNRAKWENTVHQQEQQVDSVWGAASLPQAQGPQQQAQQGNVYHSVETWTSNNPSSLGAPPPGQFPAAYWDDLKPKDMDMEQQILDVVDAEVMRDLRACIARAKVSNHCPDERARLEKPLGVQERKFIAKLNQMRLQHEADVEGQMYIQEVKAETARELRARLVRTRMDRDPNHEAEEKKRVESQNEAEKRKLSAKFKQIILQREAEVEAQKYHDLAKEEAEIELRTRMARAKMEHDANRKAEEKKHLEELKRVREEEEARRVEAERQREEERRKFELIRLEEERQRTALKKLAHQQEEIRKKALLEEKLRKETDLKKQFARKAREEEEKRREMEEKEKKKQEVLEKAKQVKEQLVRDQMAEKKKQEKQKQQAMKQYQDQQTAKQAAAQQAQLLVQHRAKAAPPAPWTLSASATRSASTSLIEIQKLQEQEKRENERLAAKLKKNSSKKNNIFDQLMVIALENEIMVSEAKASQKKAEKEAAAAVAYNQQQMQLKWADSSLRPQTPIKPLAEIQAEEQRQLAKQARAKAEISPPSAPASTAGIWNSASQSLNWSPSNQATGVWAGAKNAAARAPTASTASIWGSASDCSADTWEAIPMPPTKTVVKANPSSSKIKTPGANISTSVGAVARAAGGVATNAAGGAATNAAGGAAINTTGTNAAGGAVARAAGGAIARAAGSSGAAASATGGAIPKTASGAASSKVKTPSRAKKEEQQVMKLFEQKSQFTDDFTIWCVQTLSGLQSTVDIPTFVGFLKDIESPFEVMDYVKSYLGEGREARSFCTCFLERRSKWRNSQKVVPADDDMCKPAPAVNPMSNDSQDSKASKGKRPKKNRMQRLGSDILGFSVTAAQDRINVGDRDYAEGI